MAGRSKDAGEPRTAPLVEGARLEPIGVVKRELTRPDGTTLTVDVPVYPPFRLEERKSDGRSRTKRLDGRPARKNGKSQDTGSDGSG